MEKKIHLILKEFSTEELEKIIFTLNHYDETFDHKDNKPIMISSVSDHNEYPVHMNNQS